MKYFIIIAVFVLSGCANQQISNSSTSKQTDENKALEHIVQGYALLDQKKPTLAIKEFSKAVELCQHQYNSSDTQYYAARGTTDSLFYMMKAAADNKSAVAVSATCGEALYYKGYTYFELGDIDNAEKFVLRAIDMSPVNSMYLSELAHIYQTKKQFEKAMSIYQKAEIYAKSYTPEAEKVRELTRAKRGVGYILIEFGQYDKAEKKYKECLAIDSNDEFARNELKYIYSKNLLR